AEIDLGTIGVHLLGGQHDAPHLLRVENFGKALAIEFASGLQSRTQSVMADDVRLVFLECGGSETVVGVHVGHYDMPDGFFRALPDLRPQPPSVSKAAAGIGYENRIPPDDEADVSDTIVVV